ncbi:hypothetical protein BJV74DRAFT_823313 [Russula compacta]|nr:hypothetical protein BJV74DRAFT_823313 [Russula compacta]
MALHFRHYPNLFCLPVTLLIFALPISRSSVTFHPRRWPLAWSRCPILMTLTLDSSHPDLAPTESVRLREHVLSSQL